MNPLCKRPELTQHMALIAPACFFFPFSLSKCSPLSSLELHSMGEGARGQKTAHVCYSLSVIIYQLGPSAPVSYHQAESDKSGGAVWTSISTGSWTTSVNQLKQTVHTRRFDFS